jgi:hypothetical protein
MEPQIDRNVIWRIATAVLLVLAGSVPARARGAHEQVPAGQGLTATNPIKYRVNYRPTADDPWQQYAETRSLDKANAIASEVQNSGYLSQVVNDLTPSAQPYPDMAETSASGYYPTSNWASDYNYYVVPSRGYNYGWWGGYLPTYGYRYYPNYWWNGGGWGGWGWGRHHWGGGWHRGEGFSSHRRWNYSHVNRSTHDTHHERHSDNAHHQYHPQHSSAGHHRPGHHAAARHASGHSADHRGNSHHRAPGARTAGHRAGHRAAGHASRGHARGARGGAHHASPGGHAAGHHAAHHDP